LSQMSIFFDYSKSIVLIAARRLCRDVRIAGVVTCYTARHARSG